MRQQRHLRRRFASCLSSLLCAGIVVLASPSAPARAHGAPPTAPSLGTLIQVGNKYLFSGEWWITVFPGAMLVAISLSVNLLGDWLRDAINPRLR